MIGYGTTGKGNNTVTIGNGDITTWTPTDDGEVDLGSSSVEFKDLYVDGVAYTDAIGFGSTAMTLPTADGSNGQVLVTDGGGALSWSSTAGNATRASTLTITDNENTNESNALVFTAGGDVDGGDLGLESDGDATYNPSTGVITATGFNGNLTGTLQTAAQTNVTSLGTLSGLTVSGEASVTTLDIGGTDVTSTAAELNVLDGVTATAAELNLIDGVTATTAELNIMDGVTATAAELNIMDGDTPATSTTIANADQLILNDNGTMKQIAMTDLADYVASGSDLDILADAKSGGTNFTESLLIGHQTTGTLNAAQYNTGVGRGSLDAITEGDQNTGLGYNSLTANTTGSHNTSLGNAAGDVITTGSNNAALGSASSEWSDLFVADGGVINLGDDQDVSLTHVHDTGVLLNSSSQLQFRDSDLKVHSSTDGQLDIDANTEVEINTATVDITASSGVDFNASKIDNYSANVETGSPSGNALAISASYNGTVLLIDDGVANAVQVLTLADDLPVGFNFMVVQTGDYKIKMAATTATDLVGQGITNGTSGYLWSNGLYSVITVVVIADGKYVMSGDRSNSAS